MPALSPCLTATGRRGIVVAAVLHATLSAGSLVFPFAVGAAPAMGQKDIEEALTCQCGCGLTVATCNHLECPFAVPVRKDVAESLEAGQSGEEILERYKREYGEKVLSSPVPAGFNLVAWIGPYAAIAVAGVVMMVFFRRRARQVTEPVVHPGSASTAGGGQNEAVDQKHEQRLARLRAEIEDVDA